METVREYILSVVSSAAICGCLIMLTDGKSMSGKIIKTLCGIYMAFVMVAPLRSVDFSYYTDYFSGFSQQAQDAVSHGEAIALAEQQAFIKSQTEAYIINKAESLGADVSVSVTLNEGIPPTPSQITIRGAVSPYVKKMLSDYIKEQIGIPEEAQSWQSKTQ